MHIHILTGFNGDIKETTQISHKHGIFWKFLGKIYDFYTIYLFISRHSTNIHFQHHFAFFFQRLRVFILQLHYGLCVMLIESYQIKWVDDEEK